MIRMEKDLMVANLVDFLDCSTGDERLIRITFKIIHPLYLNKPNFKKI